MIKSLIYFSKILLSEKSWHKADQFCSFSLKLIHDANNKLGLDEKEGTAMFLCNRYWAKLKLGKDITSDVNEWNVDNMHTRYKFLKLVLLRKFDDAKRILKELLPNEKDEIQGNISFDEVDEWPILEEFRQTEQYEKLKAENKK